MTAIKYSPGNTFHPALNDEFQKVKRAIDNMSSLNGPITIYSGPLQVAGPALIVNGNVNGGAGILSQISVNAPYQAFFGKNTNNGNAAACLIECGNDTVTREIVLFNVSTTWAGVWLTGGPAGESCGLYSPFAKHMSFGVNNAVAFDITPTNTLQGFGPVAAALVDMTPDAGTFTMTYTGFTANPTGTAVWSRHGNQVTLVLPATAATTSNATTFGAGTLPVSIRPARNQIIAMPDFNVFNNSALISGVCVQINTNGTLTFFQGATGAWTASGTKGNGSPCTITYTLN